MKDKQEDLHNRKKESSVCKKRTERKQREQRVGKKRTGINNRTMYFWNIHK